ncbi:MAG TPA: hypothetical protein VFN88_12925 [Caulobacteraceae bacterium]|nr:hypothetical protein [Caulobacteraceae bacterium]
MPARSAADAREAFFQAVKGTAAPAAVPKAPPVMARPPSTQTPSAAPAATAAEPTAPQRYPRPGSIVDIKV